MVDDIYYKIQRNGKGDFNVCCIQWFDEYDYDQSLFVRDYWGDQLVFKTEDDAEAFLRECHR